MCESATRTLYIDLFAFGLEVAYIILVCTCAVPDALNYVPGHPCTSHSIYHLSMAGRFETLER